MGDTSMLLKYDNFRFYWAVVTEKCLCKGIIAFRWNSKQ